MKLTTSKLACANGLAALTLISNTPLQAVEFANIGVEQIDALNNTTSVVATTDAGSSSGFIVEGGNRGDIDVAFGYESDIDNGILITSVSQNGRDNSAVGDPAGISYAMSMVERVTSGSRAGKFYIPMFATANSASPGSSEVNMNLSAAYFPYSEGWIGGTAKNSSNNGAITDVFTGNDLAENRVLLNTNFIDPSTPSGQYTLDLSSFGYSSADGVLLVCGGKNEDNYAMSRANADGTFSVFSKGTVSNGTGGENDPVAFVFVPTDVVGSHRVIATGRVNQDSSTPVSGGSFVVTKGNTGEWYLTIPGHDNTTGVLMVSPCRGEDTDETVDNFVNYEWDPGNSRWVIQSRDIPDNSLEEATRQDANIFEFAFLSASEPENGPNVTITSPTDGTSLEFGSTINVTAGAGSGNDSIAKVRFGLENRFDSEDTASPFAGTITADRYGRRLIQAVSSDTKGIKAGDEKEIFIVPPVGMGGRFLDGYQSHINLGDVADLKLNTFTIECWFKPQIGGISAGTGSGGVTGIPLVTKGRGENDDPTFNCNYFLGIDPNTGFLVGDFEDDAGGTNHPITGITPVSEGVWQHAALSWNGTDLTLYLNGNFEAAVTPLTSVNPSSDSIHPAAIGTTFDSTGTAQGNFLGSIDEVRIWNIGRPGAEIQSDINFQLTSDQPGMVARWSLDEISGTTVTSTTNGTTLTGNVVNDLAPVAGNPFSGSRPPVITLDSPTAGVLPVNTNFTLTATASDTGGTVTQVEFFANGVSIGTDTNPPYSVVWVKPTLGDYALTASATDNDNEIATTPPVEVSVQISPAPVYQSFQNGVNGYSGTFDMAIGQVFATGVETKTLGSTVGEYFLDGDNTTDSPDINGFVRFSDIIGSATGQIPQGATILKAELTITTSTASASADSPGPWVIDRIMPGNTITEETNYSDNDDYGAPFRGLRSISNLSQGGLANAGKFGRIAVGQVVSNDITPAVQAWVDGDDNEGLMIADYYTSNGWQICTTGNSSPAKRPKLEVWYTMDNPTTYVFEANQSLFSNTAGDNVDGATILDTQFLDMDATNKQEALIGFGDIFGAGGNQIPVNAVIRQAYFKVTTNIGSNHQSPGPWYVHELLKPWSPATDYGTIGLQPGVDIGPAIDTWVGLGLQSTSVTDITRNVLAMQSGTQRYGFAITPGTTDGWGMFWPGSEIGIYVAPKLVVIASPPTGELDGFSAWAVANGVPLSETNDDDLDGIPALVEYALGLDPDSADQLPGLVVDGNNMRITFTKDAGASIDPTITYLIETSATLAPDEWQPAASTVNGTESIMATIPQGLDRMFVRLRVVRN